MRPLRPVGLFLRASSRRKKMAVEAAWELLRARLITLRSARAYTTAFGTLVNSEPPSRLATRSEEASEIGHVVEMVGRYLPFRARCLQQAIAVRRMLNRREIPALVYLGIARDPADRTNAELGQAAHAWVEVGTRVVSGDGVLEKYAIVARFA